QDYSMRIWEDPEKLAAKNMTAADMVKALREQNAQVAAGQIGQPPGPRGLDFQYTINTPSRLLEPAESANVDLKTGEGTEVSYLKRGARGELGALDMHTGRRLDGKPSVALAVFQLPGSNALEVADQVRAKMREQRQRFPQGLAYTIV